MVPNSVKNIIFDLGGVIINIKPQNTYDAFEKLIGSPINQQNLPVDHYPIFSEFERGTLSSETFLNQFRSEFNINVSDTEIIHAWNAMLLDIPSERHELLLKLKKDYNLFLLSNTNEIHRLYIDQLIRDEYAQDGLNTYFKKTFTSYELNLQKPEDAIFTQVLNDQNLIANETLFIDDTEIHLKTAQKLGIQTILASEMQDMMRIFENIK